MRLPIGIGIERDVLFEAAFPLSVYAEAVRQAGNIVESERLLKPPLRPCGNAGDIPPAEAPSATSGTRE